jgi:hypothetical protein
MRDKSERTRSHRSFRALASGAAGAMTLTALHEMTRRVVPHAPRMDVIGERALAGTIAAVGAHPPQGRVLFWQTLAGELISNTLYYGVIGAGSKARALRRGLLLGLTAGIGAVILPPRLGLGHSPGGKARLTPLLTLALYTAGGLAAGAMARLLDDSTTADAI